MFGVLDDSVAECVHVGGMHSWGCQHRRQQGSVFRKDENSELFGKQRSLAMNAAMPIGWVACQKLQLSTALLRKVVELKLSIGVEVLNLGAEMIRSPNLMSEDAFSGVVDIRWRHEVPVRKGVARAGWPQSLINWMLAYRRVREASAERPLLAKSWTKARRRDDPVAEFGIGRTRFQGYWHQQKPGSAPEGAWGPEEWLKVELDGGEGRSTESRCRDDQVSDIRRRRTAFPGSSTLMTTMRYRSGRRRPSWLAASLSKVKVRCANSRP